MLSLDKHIIDLQSPVAARMRQYGNVQSLYILIPYHKKETVALSSAVIAETTGGIKVGQFFRLLVRGRQIIREKQITAITTQDPFFLGLIGVLLKWSAGSRLEVQVHGDFYGSEYYKHSGPKNFFQYVLGLYVIRRADTIRVVGQRIATHLQQRGILKEKIIVRPVPVDAIAIHTQATTRDLRQEYPAFSKIFLCLGRLDPVKNVRWLLEVFAAVVRLKPKYGLLIVGEGPEKKRLQACIRRLQLNEHVHFLPWAADTVSMYKTVDAVLVPSLSEGYCLVAVEAIAAGARVIMNDVGVANYEVHADEQVSILPVTEPQQWIRALINLS